MTTSPEKAQHPVVKWVLKDIVLAPTVLFLGTSLFAGIWWAKAQQDRIDSLDERFLSSQTEARAFQEETRNNILRIDNNLAANSVQLARISPQIEGIHDLLTEMDKRWEEDRQLRLQNLVTSSHRK